MKNKLTITKDQIKLTLLEEPVLSPNDEVFDFVSAEFANSENTNESILTNILDKFEDKNIIKGLFLYGVFIGVDTGMDMINDEDDDFETDICTCGCVTTH